MPLSKNTRQETDLLQTQQHIITFAALLKDNNGRIKSTQTLPSNKKSINEMIKNTKKGLRVYPEEQ